MKIKEQRYRLGGRRNENPEKSAKMIKTNEKHK